MNRMKSVLASGALMGALAIGAVAATATTASADVACNRWGECWRVRDHYTNYPSNLGVMFHDDAWRDSHRSGRWHWRRDRDDDHGYYSRGRWHRFDR